MCVFAALLQIGEAYNIMGLIIALKSVSLFLMLMVLFLHSKW